MGNFLFSSITGLFVGCWPLRVPTCSRPLSTLFICGQKICIAVWIRTSVTFVEVAKFVYILLVTPCNYSCIVPHLRTETHSIKNEKFCKKNCIRLRTIQGLVNSVGGGELQCLHNGRFSWQSFSHYAKNVGGHVKRSNFAVVVDNIIKFHSVNKLIRMYWINVENFVIKWQAILFFIFSNIMV